MNSRPLSFSSLSATSTRIAILRRSEEKALSVKVRQKDKTEADETVRVIDFNNDFFLASQFWITGEIYKRRADLWRQE